MAKLNGDWFRGFGGAFETEEDVIDFIYERLNTSDFEDSCIDAVGCGELNEMFIQTANDKKTLLYDFMMSLIEG